MIIVTPSYTDYRQAEATQFLHGLGFCFSNIDTPTLYIKAEVDAFSLASTAMQNAFRPENNSEITAQLVSLDDRRDWCAKTLYNISGALAKHYEEDIAKAASRILECMSKYGDNIYKQSYPEETTSIKSLYRNLTEDSVLNLAVSTCNLAKVVDDLNSENIAFEQLYFERIRLNSKSNDISFAELQSTAFKACKTLLTKIQACCTVFPELDYEPLMRQINSTIEQFNQIVINRKAKTT